MRRKGANREAEWLLTVRERTGGAVESIEPLAGGDESEVYRLRGDDHDLVLHVLPVWMTFSRMRWVHDLVCAVASAVPEAVAPLEHQGATLFDAGGRILVLSNFVRGGHLNRESAPERRSAARLLARIHATTARWPRLISGSGSQPVGPKRSSPPPELHDPALDSWWISRQAHLSRGPIHGDFYRGNLLCEAGKVVGVVDWHEARVQPFVLEVAGAAYEVSRDDDHILDVGRAREFIEAYQGEDSPISEDDFGELSSLMRVWAREDILTSLAYSGGRETEYSRKQIRAFQELRNCEV